MARTDALTKAEQAEKRRLDRKIIGGKATRKEVLRGIELRRRQIDAFQRGDIMATAAAQARLRAADKADV